MTSSTESNFKTKVGNFLNKTLGTDPTKKDDVQSKEVLAYSVAGLGQNIICQLVTFSTRSMTLSWAPSSK